MTKITVIGAIASIAPLNGVPELFSGINSEVTLALRWLLLIVFSVAIFLIGWKTNKKKVSRVDIFNKPIEGAPNTLFFIPLQYWAFAYLALFGFVIIAWHKTEVLGN